MLEQDKNTFLKHYRSMFQAVQNEDLATANNYREKMEQIRLKYITDSSDFTENNLIESLPAFAKFVLNKNHLDLKISEPSNCINAAFNFNSLQPIYTSINTMDFLTEIRAKYKQASSIKDLKFGDWIVLWSRSDETWKNRKISVDDLDPEIPGFPFGVVFDHVMVYLDEQLIFHKPDPRLESYYQINKLEEVLLFNKLIDGFEMTFHKRILK